MQQQNRSLLPIKSDSTKAISRTKSNAVKTKIDTLPVVPIKPIQAQAITVTPSKSIELPEKEFISRNADWITLVMLLALVVLVLVRNAYSKFMHQIFSAAANKTSALRLFGESSSNFGHATLLMKAFSYLVFAMFVYQALNLWGFDLGVNGLLLYAICFVGVVIYFRLKFAIHRLLGVVFFYRNEAIEFNFNAEIYNKVLGIALFPVVLINAYASGFLLKGIVITGVVVFLCTYLLMLFRGFSIFIRKHASIYYLILYLCTLEILPMVLIWKTLLIEGK
ncbi:DUF4271 domain-containing protein [Prolixibacteraceae bacterium JC049]|nr:DUF4271 domain-containing protein [Prolixibacteraceae bacterium JC049]